MAFKAIMRGVGAAAESVGKGLARIDTERKETVQQKFENDMAKDMADLKQQEIDLAEKVHALDLAERDDRPRREFFERQTALMVEQKRLLRQSRAQKHDKETAALLSESEMELDERRGHLNLLNEARLLKVKGYRDLETRYLEMMQNQIPRRETGWFGDESDEDFKARMEAHQAEIDAFSEDIRKRIEETVGAPYEEYKRRDSAPTLDGESRFKRTTSAVAPEPPPATVLPSGDEAKAAPILTGREIFRLQKLNLDQRREAIMRLMSGPNPHLTQEEGKQLWQELMTTGESVEAVKSKIWSAMDPTPPSFRGLPNPTKQQTDETTVKGG